jgi:hypothetical protein
MSDGAFIMLGFVALCLPFLLAVPATRARRRIGVPIALVGAIFGAIACFSATPPGDHSPVYRIDYLLQRGYGGMLLAVHGLIALVRIGLALREAYRPWPDDTRTDEVTAREDLPRARVESAPGEAPPG